MVMEMSLARQIKRQGLNKYSHCGRKMTPKEGYNTEKYELWVCEKCGKTKWIEKAVVR